MFFDAGQTESALGATVPPKAPASGQNRNLSKDQFGKTGGSNPTEGESPMEGAAGAGAGEAGAAGAAGGAEAAELLPLLLV